MAYFLNLFSPPTWRSFLEMGGNLTGFRQSMESRARREIHRGDFFVCYLSGASRLCGVLRVESEAFVEPTHMNDPFSDYPIRFEVSTIVALEPEFMVPVKEERIWDRWSVTRVHDKHSQWWSGWSRSSLRNIPDDGGDFVVQELIGQGTNATSYPLTAKDRRVLRPLLGPSAPSVPTVPVVPVLADPPIPDETRRAPVQQPLPQWSDLVDDVYLPETFLRDIEMLLEDKKQVIFQGPPGTGKTYVARKLAEHLAGTPNRVTLVQLHPSYAYEDFVQGFRPVLRTGQMVFRLADGPLMRAAKAAMEEPKEKHFLVIDEINRGNVARVFGELYFLLEYRGQDIRLQYQDDSTPNFVLPENLYVIGTMNTADRSIALVDLALRRRFYFVDFHPYEEPVKSVLRLWLEENAPGMDWVAAVVDRANGLLKDDRHAAIGPSYFMKPGLTDEVVERIWKHSVMPYLAERFFTNEARLEEFDLDKLRRGAGTGSHSNGVADNEGSDEPNDADGTVDN